MDTPSLSATDLGTLLFRTSVYERNRPFRTALAEMTRVGLRWSGVIGIVGVVLYVTTYRFLLGYPLAWTYADITTAPHVTLPTVLIISAVSAGLVVASQTDCSVQTGRLVMAVAVLACGQVVIYDGIFENSRITDYLGVIFLVGVAAIPFRPWQVLGIGATLVTALYVFGVLGVVSGVGNAQLPLAYAQMTFTAVATMLLTGVSAVLYVRHWARVQSEDALRESQELLHQAETIAQVGGWSVDLKTGDLEWTPEVYDIFGIERGTALQLSDVLNYYPPDARERLVEAYDRCRLEGEPYDLELPIHPNGGGKRWVRVRGEARRRDGEIVRLVGAIQDVTERHRIERELRSREELLRSINENVSEGIYRSAPEEGLIYVNQAFARIFGYDSPSDILEQDSAELYANPEIRNELARQLDEEGELQGREVRYRRKDGSTFIGRLTSTVVRDDDGSVRYYDGIVADITERKRRERQLEAAKEEAETARREAEEASRSKSRFLAGVAHDLRSPLAAIEGFSRLLTRDLSGKQKKQAASIQSAARQIDGMAESLMELAQLEAGGLELDLTPTDVRPIVRDVADGVQQAAADAGVDLTVDLPDAPARAVADAESLTRVIDNLARNAVKYSGEGDCVTVRVHTESPEASPESDGAGRVVLTVADTGPGIDQDFLERIFEPFARNAPETDGTGLGLAVTKELVEAMQGSIDVESELGEGTSFCVRLPAAG